MAIQRAYGTGNALIEARKLMANVVAGQFLPEGVVKGGSSIRLRYGTTATRFTVDLDTAWKSGLDVFLKAMKKNGFYADLYNAQFTGKGPQID